MIFKKLDNVKVLIAHHREKLTKGLPASAVIESVANSKDEKKEEQQ